MCIFYVAIFFSDVSVTVCITQYIETIYCGTHAALCGFV